MKLLLEQPDPSFPKDESDVTLRDASRAVLMDDQNRVALLHVSNHNYHKLPGGGIKSGEDKHTALKRETLEETGCQIDITGEVGKSIEYYSALTFDREKDVKQTSYCYLAKVVSTGEPDFTELEQSEGFELMWLPLDKTIKLLEQDQPNVIEGENISQRDLTFLQKARDILNLETVPFWRTYAP